MTYTPDPAAAVSEVNRDAVVAMLDECIEWRERANAAEANLDRELQRQENFHEWADRLAYGIAPMEQLGEHSSLNNPWANALDALAGERQAAEAQVAQLRAALPDALKLDLLADWIDAIRPDGGDEVQNDLRSWAAAARAALALPPPDAKEET